MTDSGKGISKGFTASPEQNYLINCDKQKWQNCSNIWVFFSSNLCCQICLCKSFSSFHIWACSVVLGLAVWGSRILEPPSCLFKHNFLMFNYRLNPSVLLNGPLNLRESGEGVLQEAKVVVIIRVLDIKVWT